MSLIQFIQDKKEQFYELAFKLSTLFPGSNYVFHAGLIGVLPFLAGKCSAEFIARYLENYPNGKEFLERNAERIGFVCAFGAEGFWMLGIEPGSKYNHPDDDKGRLYGVMATGIGAFTGAVLNRVNDYRLERRREMERNGVLEFKRPRRKYGLRGK